MARTGKVALVTGGGSGIRQGIGIGARPATALCRRRRRAAVPIRSRRWSARSKACRAGHSASRPMSAIPAFGGGAVRPGPRAQVRGGLMCSSTTPGLAPARRSRISHTPSGRAVVDTILTGLVPVHPAGLPMMKDQQPMGGRIHQQRLHLGACAAAQFGRLHLVQARGSPASPNQPRSTAANTTSSCGQIDVGNALTEMTQRMTRGRAATQRRGYRRADDGCRERRPAQSSFMSSVTPEAKRPVHHRDGDQDAFVGRG